MLCPQAPGQPNWRKVQKSWGPKPQPDPLPPTRAQPTQHLAQLEDGLQGAPHPVGLGLLHSLPLLQLPHELQRPGPTLPAGVDQAWGRGLSGEPAPQDPGRSLHTGSRPGSDARTCLQAPTLPWSTTRTCGHSLAHLRSAGSVGAR